MDDEMLSFVPGQNHTLLDEEPICGEYEQYTLVRFALISCASLVALAGIGANSFLVLFFSIRKTPKTPPTLYPLILALLDWLMCAMYITLFGADAAVVYLSSKTLFLIYHAYIVPAFLIGRITQLAIPYVLILATLERFVWITAPIHNKVLKAMYSRRGRFITVVSTMLLCVVLRLPVGWAIIVYDFPNCREYFRTKMANVAPWARESYAYFVYDFHILSIAQTFLPFAVLVILNMMVVRKMIRVRSQSGSNSLKTSGDGSTPFCSTPTPSTSPCVKVGSVCNGEYPALLVPNYSYHQRSSSVSTFDVGTYNPGRSGSRRTDRAVRAAIYTMLGIVTSYLVSNTLHVILTVLERSESPLLIDHDDPAMASTFHTYFSDVVSLVYMLTSAGRILIYVLCNPAFRADFSKLWRDLVVNCRGAPFKQMDNSPVML